MGGSMAVQLAKHHNVALYDHFYHKASSLADEIGAEAPQDLASALQGTDLIIVAVKPSNLEELAKQFGDHATQDQILVSVVGSTPLSELEKLFGQLRIVRAMPNIACAYGKGVLGCVETGSVSEETKQKVETGLSSLGTIHWLPEHYIEALTAIAGSGPAFAFVIVEAMVDAGIAMGLPADLAKKLSCEMWEGAITLMRESGRGLSDLKWQVSSPGGVTIAGLQALESEGVRSGIINTLLATFEKSLEEQE